VCSSKSCRARAFDSDLPGVGGHPDGEELVILG
jgi:hypothetical protein